jgi:hypothetical protein
MKLEEHTYVVSRCDDRFVLRVHPIEPNRWQRLTQIPVSMNYTLHDPLPLSNRRDGAGATNEHTVTRCQHPASVGAAAPARSEPRKCLRPAFRHEYMSVLAGTRQDLDSACRKQSSRASKNVCGTKSGSSELGRSLRQEPSSSTRHSHCERRD